MGEQAGDPQAQAILEEMAPEQPVVLPDQQPLLYSAVQLEDQVE